jgi:hypothetical protein
VYEEDDLVHRFVRDFFAMKDELGKSQTVSDQSRLTKVKKLHSDLVQVAEEAFALGLTSLGNTVMNLSHNLGIRIVTHQEEQ